MAFNVYEPSAAATAVLFKKRVIFWR